MHTITHRRHGHGFTLIEVLTVVGICAVIAAIVIPVFLSVRENGRRTACLSNERQIGMAMLEYVDDNDGVFPSWKDMSSDWPTLVFPFLKSEAVFSCPDDATQLSSGDSGMFINSYGLNSDLMGSSLSVTGRTYLHPVVPQYTLVSPSRTVMFFEVTNIAYTFNTTFRSETGFPIMNGAFGNVTSTCVMFPCGFGLVYYEVPGPYGNGFPLYATGSIGGRILDRGYPEAARHNGGSDFVACDGHVQWLLGKDVSGGRTAPAEDCNQGTEENQPTDCIERQHIKWSYAAGTQCPRYRLTFSPT